MDIKTHATKLATAFGAVDRANGKVVANLKAFINEASIGDSLIENFLTELTEQAKGKVKDSSLKVYKSQTKRILVLAKDHKTEVLKLADNAGNLTQWYQACLDPKNPRKPATKVTTKKADKAEPVKLQDEAKEPSEVVNPIDQFKTALRAMLDAGMTMHQIQTIIAQETKVAQAA